MNASTGIVYFRASLLLNDGSAARYRGLGIFSLHVPGARAPGFMLSPDSQANAMHTPMLQAEVSANAEKAARPPMCKGR